MGLIRSQAGRAGDRPLICRIVSASLVIGARYGGETDNARAILRFSGCFLDCSQCIRPDCATRAHSGIPAPLPFPQGSSVFQWDYECIGQKGCGFTGFGLDRLSLRSASIVLARLKVGEIEMPTYFVWGTLIDGTPVTGMVQNEFSFRFSAVNMRLIAAGSPGL